MLKIIFHINDFGSEAALLRQNTVIDCFKTENSTNISTLDYQNKISYILNSFNILLDSIRHNENIINASKPIVEVLLSGIFVQYNGLIINHKHTIDNIQHARNITSTSSVEEYLANNINPNHYADIDVIKFVNSQGKSTVSTVISHTDKLITTSIFNTIISKISLTTPNFTFITPRILSYTTPLLPLNCDIIIPHASSTSRFILSKGLLAETHKYNIGIYDILNQIYDETSLALSEIKEHISYLHKKENTYSSKEKFIHKVIKDKVKEYMEHIVQHRHTPNTHDMVIIPVFCNDFNGIYEAMSFPRATLKRNPARIVHLADIAPINTDTINGLDKLIDKKTSLFMQAHIIKQLID